MYVLDTNTLIYFFKGQGRVAERMLAISPKDIGLPAIALYELEVGIAKSSQPDKRRQQLDELITMISVLPFARAAAAAAATVRAELEALGCPIGPLDTLIAGTALSHGATLVTHNTHEFERVPGLSLGDWYH